MRRLSRPAARVTAIAGLCAGMAFGPQAAASDNYDPEPGPSRWVGVPGADPEAGATNTQTPAKALEAVSRIRLGKVYRLGHAYDDDMPINPTALWQFEPKLPFQWNQQIFTGEVVASDLGHVGTQIDALGHFGWMPPGATSQDEALFYNRYTGAEVLGPDGLERLGIEKMRPFFTRGILLDVKRYVNNNETLAPGYEITVADIEATLAAQALGPQDIREGDVVLIRTGWEEKRHAGLLVYFGGGPGVPGGTPGIGLEAAMWLADKRVACVGADNWGVKVAGEGDNTPPPPGVDFPVHHHLLVKHGIPLQEELKLSELSDDLAAAFEAETAPGLRKKVYTFAYIFNPVPIRGASGSPGVPLAVR